jgi:hypothetical protein
MEEGLLENKIGGFFTMNKRVLKIEEALHVVLPKEYADFIEKTGYQEINGMEIYGYLESMIHVDRIPCVIGATQRHRMEGLEHWFIVLAHTGFEDRIILLDTESGELFEDGQEGRSRISSSFNAWQEKLQEKSLP